MRGAWVALGSALIVASAARTASAVDWEVTGDVAAQGYDVVSPWGDVVLGRRRLTSSLGLAAYNLQGGGYQPFKANYSVQIRMRVDADFGIKNGESKYDASDATRFVPGLAYSPVDLMYGYVEGRNLFNGVLDFKVGRQYTTNVLGWWSFDGALVHVTTPFFFALEAYGGLEQRGGLPLSTARFETQGVWRGGHGGALGDDAARYPSYQFAAAAPAFGVALESSGPNWIHGRLDYRRVYNLGDAFTGQFGFPNTFDANGAPVPGSGGFEKVSGLRISSDRVGYALTAFLSDIGALRGGFVYDLYYGHLSRGYGSLDIYAGKRATLGLDGEYFWPTFDADSIFNWFTHDPNATALARVAARPTDRIDITAQAGAKLWLTEGDPASWRAAQCNAAGLNTAELVDTVCARYGLDPSSGAAHDYTRADENRASHVSPDLLANFAGSYAWTSGFAGLRGSVQTGFGDVSQNRGRRVGGQLSATQAIVPGVFWIRGRVSTYEWHDPARPDRDATSFGYVVAPEVQPVQFGKIRVEWEHETNRLVGQRFRLLGIISLRVAP